MVDLCVNSLEVDKTEKSILLDSCKVFTIDKGYSPLFVAVSRMDLRFVSFGMNQ